MVLHGEKRSEIQRIYINNMDIKNLFNLNIDSLTKNSDKKGALEKLSFKKDWPNFRVDDGKIYFTEKASTGFTEESKDLFLNTVKNWIKSHPKLFYFIWHVIGSSFLGKSAKQAISGIPVGNIVLNLGSGVTVVRSDVVNIDFYPFQNVDFVADIANLPISDSSVDGIICEQVLEHIPDPEAVVREIHRILKPGGIVYIVVPFVFSFHASPYDYYRWSHIGLREQFKDFKQVDAGMRSGPGAGLNYILAEFFSMLLSFGIRRLQQIWFMIFLILFAPLCYLDYIIYRFPTAENIASHIYFIGKK